MTGSSKRCLPTRWRLPRFDDGRGVRSKRIYLDLTGRIPTFEQTNAFLADTTPGKRDKLIDTLLNSPAYVDQFSVLVSKALSSGRRRQFRRVGLYRHAGTEQFLMRLSRQFGLQTDRPYDGSRPRCCHRIG